ncbi:DNA-3-methyladenine glycosylase family protein [Staphylococcus pettenkoferi]|uniref:DNA-3-methyladenine glycosylase family protein n=1 Tax=Staphylococcus pettenkoferi TaxID=170573 RepID=UPI0011A2ECF1|nr:DNA-3-methyladenine glycosylase [Staphylococcus pettenkoferi]MCY1589547.1 DNA-3-methyladenine glycosylase [Staphylococcus pettenkoferi]MCY1592455.1 DNA-3-methyladenine glycosylase [Staphylococcus pettenkoferi]MCY1599052.1 DNA-3-methyladenine glycosylase [Staphylococcus pettenkoferi]MCY1602611.1 DNA-3-methyladenine glycosylase [Staphylococcus pettenkoferi]MCY1608925.1 DNA-3-methyladenine glycosylase [Staphylococcus pettenkoferi]
MEKLWHISKDDNRVQKLAENDKVMGRLIERIGDVERALRPYPLKSLVRSIVGQQISVKAAETIFGRLKEKINDEWTIAAFKKLTEEDCKEIGLSRSKQKYIFNLVEHIDNGELEFEKLDRLSNEEIIKQLTAVKGIGKWTAEVFLIFTMQRENVVPVDDVGLQRAAKRLYEQPEARGKALLKECKATWGDQGTIGCLYLWEYIHQYQI